MKSDSWPLKRETVTPDTNGVIKIKAAKDVKRILVLPYNENIKSFSVEFLVKKRTLKKRYVTIEKYEKKIFKPEPVYFRFNSASICITDIPYLQEVVNHMRSNPEVKIELKGFADQTGTTAANQDISLKRAEAVKRYITESGINKKRITAKGAGYVAEAEKPYIAQQSRRVEFSIIEK